MMMMMILGGGQLGVQLASYLDDDGHAAVQHAVLHACGETVTCRRGAVGDSGGAVGGQLGRHGGSVCSISYD